MCVKLRVYTNLHILLNRVTICFISFTCNAGVAFDRTSYQDDKVGSEEVVAEDSHNFATADRTAAFDSRIAEEDEVALYEGACPDEACSVNYDSGTSFEMTALMKVYCLDLVHSEGS